MSDDQRPAGTPFGERKLARRPLLLGAMAAGVLQACSTRAVSTVRSSPSDDVGPTTTGPDGAAPGTTSTTAAPASTVRPTAAETVTEPLPGAIDEAATTDETAVRVAPPGPPGAYDREARYVGLYGFPGSSVLGSLGEQGPDASVRRAQELAALYEPFGRRVVPTFEILASVASSRAGTDGDFSNEFDPQFFQPYLDAAAAAAVHVVFDLQSGRARFPDQARDYEALWLFPHTSIALDPEWRVGPDERPGGGFIGSVDAAEVNETIDYVDGLIRQHGLPPKMCVVHQFDPSMITNKQQIRGTDLVQVVIQMDGFGTLQSKRGSWARTVSDLPAGAFAGWKNFFDEDRPTPTAAETMANEPEPRYVSYQ